MTGFKKIFARIDEDSAALVERLAELESRQIVLSIPSRSVLLESRSSFTLLRREINALKKVILIESVDPEVIVAARAARFKTRNPFGERRNKRLADIVKSTSPLVSEVVASDFSEDDREEATASPTRRVSGGGAKTPPRRILVRLAFFAVAFALLFGGGYVAVAVLPRADIKITVRRVPWKFDGAVTIDKNLSRLAVEAVSVPGQLFVQKKNFDSSYPATGKKEVSRAATGKIVIYNNYSSEPQSLVARTRFRAPDGKIFRLVKNVLIPGAKVVDQKIVPSSIEVEVVADKTGADYNIGPVEKFVIPGFEGTPKFAAFYAASKMAMTGGVVGVVPFPTAADIENAKTAALTTVRDALTSALLAQAPQDLKVVSGATDFKLITQKVREVVDAEGRFSIFTEAQMTMMAFRESDLVSMLRAKAEKEAGPDLVLKHYSLEYGTPKFLGSSGRLELLVVYRAELVREVDLVALRRLVIGKSEPELKVAVLALPGLESAQISLWPFWVRTVPTREQRVIVNVQ